MASNIAERAFINNEVVELPGAPVGYVTVGNFFSVSTQAGLSDIPKTIHFDSGGATDKGEATVAANGEITVGVSGYYSLKQRFRVGRSGASGTSDIFFYAEVSVDGGSTWNIIGNSVDLALDSAKDITVFFDVASIYLGAGTMLRNRFIRSGDGDNSGDLLVGTPSAAMIALGIPVAPSAQLTVSRLQSAF